MSRKRVIGRVVYRRKKNFFRQRDVNRIYAKAILDDHMTREQLLRSIWEVYAIYLHRFGQVAKQMLSYPWVQGDVEPLLDRIAGAIAASGGDRTLFRVIFATGINI